MQDDSEKKYSSQSSDDLPDEQVDSTHPIDIGSGVNSTQSAADGHQVGSEEPTIVIQQEPNMETHAYHLHKAPGKKFSHYFFEFFMLFLAVTAGFFVENLREHYVEQKRAKDFAGLLISDLNADRAELNRASRILANIIAAGDSLASQLSAADAKRIPGGKLYFYEYWAAWRWRVTSRDATLQQLKNSGSLRYMNNSLVRKILDYEESLKIIYLLQDEYETDKNENLGLVQRVFDSDYFVALDNLKPARRDSSEKHLDITNEEVRSFMNKNIPLHSYDEAILFELKNRARNSSISYRVQVQNIETAQKKAQVVIDALESEYHI